MNLGGHIIEAAVMMALFFMAREVALLLGVSEDSWWGLIITTFVVVFIMAGYSKNDHPGGKQADGDQKNR